VRIAPRLRSFLVGYLLVPVAFYTVDVLGHMPRFAVLFPLVLTLALVGTAVGGFLALRFARSRLGIESPQFAGIGASLGLMHWFPLYLWIGSHTAWHPAAGAASLSRILYLYLLNLLIPIIALSGGTYDGSVIALIVSPLLIIPLARRWQRETATPSPETSGPRRQTEQRGARTGYL
jgi:hypothetical protein